MDSDLTGDLGNSNIILPTIIYSGVPAGYDCLVLSDLVRSSGSAIFVLKDDKLSLIHISEPTRTLYI